MRNERDLERLSASGLVGLMLPFHPGYRPAWTGLGVIAGWLAVSLGLIFYVRKRIGVKTWRWMHRFTLAVYVLALGHAARPEPTGAGLGCCSCSLC